METCSKATTNARRVALLAIVLLLLSVSSLPCNAQICWLFFGYFNGSEMVPPSESTGVAYLVSSFSSCWECPQGDGDAFSISLSLFPPLSHLEGTPTALQFHIGKRGVNGPLLHEVSLQGVPQDFHASFVLDTLYCSTLMDTSLHVVVLTDRFPEGEVRSQLYPQAPYPAKTTTWGEIRHDFR